LAVIHRFFQKPGSKEIAEPIDLGDLIASCVLEPHAPSFKNSLRRIAGEEIENSSMSRVVRDGFVKRFDGVDRTFERLKEAPVRIEEHAGNLILLVFGARHFEQSLKIFVCKERHRRAQVCAKAQLSVGADTSITHRVRIGGAGHGR
jgi:hypothetical protein